MTAIARRLDDRGYPSMDARFSVPGVDSDTQLGVAAPAILAAKAAPLFRLEGAARSGADADAVHDMRVASRRLREAWRLFSPVYSDSATAGWYARVRRITKALGPVRDSDVFIEEFSDMASKLGDGGRRAVAFLVGHRLGQREQQLEQLNRELAHLDLRRAKKEFSRLIQSVAEGPSADRPLTDFAHAAVAERAAIVFGMQPAALHEANISLQHQLRIAYKRLRYAVEALAPCYGDAFDGVHEVLTAFQEALGDLHDRHLFLDLVAAIEDDPGARHAGVSEADFAEVRDRLDAEAREAFGRFTQLAAEHPAEVLLPELLLPLTKRPAEVRVSETASVEPADEPASQPDVAREAVEAFVVEPWEPTVPYVSDNGDLVMPPGGLALGEWTPDLGQQDIAPEMPAAPGIDG